MNSLRALLDPYVATEPTRTAIIDDGREYSFADMAEASRTLAWGLQQGLAPGDRIALLLPNSVELMTCWLACFLTGVIAVPFEYRDAPPEVRYGLVDSGARWFIVHAEKVGDLARIDLSQTAIERVFVVGSPVPKAYAPLASLLVGAGAPVEIAHPVDAPAFILYTSGSTDLPKGVMHSHGSAAGIMRSFLDAFPGTDPASTFVVHDSLSHIDGWFEAFPVLAAGGRVAIAREFEASKFFSDLRTYRPTHMFAHIEDLWTIVREPSATRADFASLKYAFTGGDELPLPLAKQFLDLAGVPMISCWGMTEALTLTVTEPALIEQRGAMGRPVKGVTLRLVDKNQAEVEAGKVGEIQVQGDMVMLGYWNRADATRDTLRDGWLHTGDCAWRDPSGNYWFAGRIKQIIERNSENITPGEVEQAIFRNPAVADVGVIGVDDPDEGQVPAAFVVLKNGEALTADQLSAFLENEIAPYKIPKYVYFVERIPLTPGGKIDHAALRDVYARLEG